MENAFWTLALLCRSAPELAATSLYLTCGRISLIVSTAQDPLWVWGLGNIVTTGGNCFIAERAHTRRTERVSQGVWHTGVQGPGVPRQPCDLGQVLLSLSFLTCEVGLLTAPPCGGQNNGSWKGASPEAEAL